MGWNKFGAGSGEKVRMSVKNYNEKEAVNDTLLSRAAEIIRARDDIPAKDKELLSGVFYHVMRGTDITDIANEFLGKHKTEKQKAAERDVFKLFNRAEEIVRKDSGIQITPEYVNLVADVRKKLRPIGNDVNNDQLSRPLIRQDDGKKIG